MGARLSGLLFAVLLVALTGCGGQRLYRPEQVAAAGIQPAETVVPKARVAAADAAIEGLR